MNSIKNVIEGNVKYSVDCDKFDPVIITVENINNKNKETYDRIINVDKIWIKDNSEKLNS